MLRRLFAGLTLSASLCAASSAYALVDAELLVGRRWYKFENNSTNTTFGVAAQEVTLAAHIDPIPLVPIAFGASVSILDLQEDDWGTGTSSSKGAETALEIMTWLPMVPVVTPYARFKYPVISRIITKGSDTNGDHTVTQKLSGYHLNAGLRYSPLPLFSVLAEVGMGMQKAKVDKYELNGQSQSTSAFSDTDANSQVFLVGVQLGI